MSARSFTVLAPFGGSGGGMLGFQKARVRLLGHVGAFRVLGSIDFDREACIDFERLTGAPAWCTDMTLVTGSMQLEVAVEREGERRQHRQPPGRGGGPASHNPAAQHAIAGVVRARHAEVGTIEMRNGVAVRVEGAALPLFDEPRLRELTTRSQTAGPADSALTTRGAPKGLIQMALLKTTITRDGRTFPIQFDLLVDRYLGQLEYTAENVTDDDYAPLDIELTDEEIAEAVEEAEDCW